MPGSSLWLLPPPTSPLHRTLTTLITTTLPTLLPLESTSATLSPSFFAPHLTLTSNIPPSVYTSSPQAWLDSLPLPSVRIRLTDLCTHDVFFRRCFLQVARERGVEELAAVARKWGVEGGDEERVRGWLEGYGPHVSLMYGSVPMDEERMGVVRKAVEEAGVALGEEGSGWEGGVVWLVPTDRPIGEWKPIAVREL
ncbi:putative cyclic phosphodiesterase [Podospora conica]|nr:putative cyclic phosphodiesterase [Schizothecium conicum]